MKLAPDQLKNANDRLTYMTPEMRCLERVQNKGYTDQFRAEGKTLHCLSDSSEYRPEEVTVVNFYRFEGISDPDDMSIIYVIETNSGRKGTIIDAYGVYADDSVCDFINRVHDFGKRTNRGWS